MADLTQQEWAMQLKSDDNAIVLDVRTEEEVEAGSIPNAKNIDIYQPNEFMEAIQALDKTKNYYAYCRSGVRSAQACALMNQLGFENTYNLLGGFLEWDN